MEEIKNNKLNGQTMQGAGMKSVQQAILDNIPDIAWLKDKESRFIAVNEAFGRACGVKPEDLVGKTDLDIWPLELAESYRADDREVMRSGKRKIVEERLADKEGKVQWIETIKTPIYNEKNEIVGTTGIARDITERKQAQERQREVKAELEIRVKVRTAELTRSNEELLKEVKEHKETEEALRESESRFRTIFENVSAAIFIADVQTGMIVECNSRAEQLIGRERREIIGIHQSELHPVELREEYKKMFKEHANAKTRSDSEAAVLHKDGRVIPVWIKSQTIKMSGKELVMGIFMDITQRRKIEQTLKESEARFRELFDNMSSGVAVYEAVGDGQDFIFRDFNSAAERIENIKKEDIVGRGVSEVFPGVKDSGLLAVFKKVWITGLPVRFPPFLYKDSKMSGWRENYVYKLPCGQIVAVYDDVTERVKAKEQLESLNAELIKSNRVLKQLCLTDSHTGLYNYRYLEDVIEAEFYRARRYLHPLAIIMLDIDYFKSVNDVYGHQFGDLVLKQLARQLKRLVRKYDVVIRYGGEEFVVVSPGVNREQALSLAQRLLDALNLYNFGDSKHNVKLKLSLAVATYPEDTSSKGMDLINLANQILSKVKESGGNRVYSSSDLKKGKPEPQDVHSESADVKLLKGKIEKLTKRANESLVEAIFAFAKTIELKDHYTGEHVEKTVQFATDLARALGLPREEIELVKQAAMLHDLGKIGISENILLKKGKLTKGEFEQIKKHPQIGADIIRPIQVLHGLIPYISYHHERWDGKGYPAGIKAEEIPIGARIIAIADVFQALISDRPYRKAYSKAEAVRIIKDGAGSQFDPRIVAVFLKVLQKKKK